MWEGVNISIEQGVSYGGSMVAAFLYICLGVQHLVILLIEFFF